MKIYKENNINNTISNIENPSFVEICKQTIKSFSRNRKLTCKDLVYYELNKRGLSTKMEILNFNNINYVEDVSSPALFKQRENLNPDAFTYLIQDSLINFYTNYKNEVKTYNGYVLLAVDGSDFEIPNSIKNRSQYNGKLQEQCARITVSTLFDVLNKYTLDTIVEQFDFSEIKMMKSHIETIENKQIIDDYKFILLADRNYKSLDFFYNAIKKDDKFAIRIGAKVYKKETSKMQSNDEIIEIGYEYNRVKYYKESAPELYNYLLNGNTIKIRCVKIELDTGEIEYILTNLTKEQCNTKEIKALYNLRWKIELNYKHLKNNVKIECISSGKIQLIKQDIFSQVLVVNMLQAFINDGDETVSKFKYKNNVKVNNNMAIGIFKNTLIYIFLEEDSKKRSEMMRVFQKQINSFIVPIKPGRKSPRKNNPKNRYHINQRKTF